MLSNNLDYSFISNEYGSIAYSDAKRSIKVGIVSVDSKNGLKSSL
jgi:hypothetical protein